MIETIKELESQAISKNSSTSLEAKESSKKHDFSDALVWAFALLLDAVNITSSTAEIHAKTLAAQAGAEEKLNNEMRQATWGSVPKIHHTKSHHIHPDFWTKRFWKHVRHEMKHMHHENVNPFSKKGWRKGHQQTVDVVPGKIDNMTAVDIANFDNATKNKWREDLQSQMSIVQQNSQVGQTVINTDINESERSTQEASSILGILDALTLKILNKGQ